MKLYAITTSERGKNACKGGNDHLLIVLTAEIDGQRQEIASMSAVRTSAGYRFNYALPDGTARSMVIK